MACVRSGQAAAWPLCSGRCVRRDSVKRHFACTSTRHLLPVLVVLRLQWRLMLEGRTRTLRGPSPDLSPAETFAPSIECVSLYFCAVLLAYDLPLAVVWAQSNVQNVPTDTYCQHHLNIIRRRGQHGNKVRYRMDANYLEPYYWL